MDLERYEYLRKLAEDYVEICISKAIFVELLDEILWLHIHSKELEAVLAAMTEGKVESLGREEVP